MTTWASGICRANGVEIHYLRTGGAKPPLVLLHGLTGDGACWTPLARALEGDYDVVMPDARGHGRSSTPPRGYTYDDLATDVVELTRTLGLSAPLLLGHSMGGMTAAVAARRRASGVRGVVLLDPTFLSPERQREVHGSDVAAQHRALLARDASAVVAELTARHPRRSPEIVALVAAARLRTRIEAFDVLAPPTPDFREVAGAIDAPLLLVVADGGVLSLETARELQQINPRVDIASIADAGHALQYDQPERVAAVVRVFLRAVVAAPGARPEGAAR